MMFKTSRLIAPRLIVCCLTITLSALTSYPVSAQNTAEKTPTLADGDKAPDFELPLVGSDDYLTLKDAIADGPAVVIVLRGYPGYQCPLCSKQVSSIANRAKALGQQAKRVILVYPGEATLLERHAEEFVGSRSLPEPLVMVRDPGMRMIESWGLRWDAPRETAYPATYVIQKNGRVAWSKVSKSHAGRSTVDEILAALKKL
ncbi:redoxin family protein [Stieleria varia]|uniref:Redoxin n=1 Tax=Stieleria varia TaxID=2528005 RepID=A0A5C5ZVQ0_9BACT|nr:redoxin family protein [Stieleria varia]TWT91260.1 Redoxin [Stieleria varia]